MRDAALTGLFFATRVMGIATGICGLLWGAYFALRLVHAVGLASTDIGDIRFENEQVLGFGFLLVVLACLTLVLQRTRLAIARQADEALPDRTGTSNPTQPSIAG